jgi:3-hydroxybutyryl-CoA dehydrogenase
MSVAKERFCVIGAGTMGTGIAQAAAQAGFVVVLIDRDETALSASRGRLDRSLTEGIERAKLTVEQAEEVRRRVTWEVAQRAVAEADWVIEAVPEDMALKAEVLQAISALAVPETPIATNTSTLRISALASHCARPERFLGLHFFNPVPAMKLVEVIPGAVTAQAVTEVAVGLCRRLGKTAVLAPDIPGFLVNRVFAALVSAAVDLWAHGAAPEAIDQAIELGLAHKLGPLRSADLVGLDVMLAVLRSLHGQTGDLRFDVPEAFAELVASGKLGRKTGEGFYSYTEEPA